MERDKERHQNNVKLQSTVPFCEMMDGETVKSEGQKYNKQIIDFREDIWKYILRKCFRFTGFFTSYKSAE